MNSEEHEVSSSPIGLSRDSQVDVSIARPGPRPLRWLSYALVGILTAQFVHMLFTNPNFEWPVVSEWFTAKRILIGLLMTLLLTAIAMVMGIVLGTLLALARMSTNILLSGLATGYVWLFRAIPELVQLLFWFNLAALLPQISIGIPFGPEFVVWQTNDLITVMTAAILGLGLLESAYMAEVVRGGIFSVDEGQKEAGQAVGMSAGRVMRRVILPQAMRFMIPPTGNNTIRMVKGTALVSVIGMNDLLHQVQLIYSQTFQTIPLLIVAVGWYLIVNSILFVIQGRLETVYGRGQASASARRVKVPWRARLLHGGKK